MPAYEVEHICPLTDAQTDQLAEEITRIHSEQFSTPRLFVNVRFTNIATHVTYVAGKRRKTNRIFANVRHNDSRTQADYDEVCAALMAAWGKIVGTKGDQELRAIFVIGGLIAAAEAGFSLPPAGQDAGWLRDNVGNFKKLADSGDEEFQELMEELKSREVFKGALQEAY